MYAQFHKHNQCAEWRHWYSGKKKKISLLFLSYGKAVNGPYHTNCPPHHPPTHHPPPQQPTSTQSLIPPSSKQYAAVLRREYYWWPRRNHQQASCTCHSLQATPVALLWGGHVDAPLGNAVSSCACSVCFRAAWLDGISCLISAI